MISFGDILTTGFVPLGVALVVVLIARWCRLRPALVWPLGLACGYIVAHLAYHSQGKGVAVFESLWKPQFARDWLPWAVLAVLVVSLIGAVRAWRWPVLPLLAAIVSIALPMRLLWKSIYVQSEWSTGQAAIWLGSLALGMWILWMLFHTSRAAADPRLRLALLTIVTLATSVVLAMSGVLVYGLLAGALAAAMVGTAAVPLVRRDPTEDVSAGLASGGGVPAVLLGGLILLGYFFAELTATNAILLTVAIAAAVAKLPIANDSHPAARLTLRSLACLVPLAIAVTLATQAFLAAMAERAEYY